MQIDPQDLSRSEAYALMIGGVIPRPIAWVSSLDAEGHANLAPFSFFGGVSSHPPTVMLSVGRRDGEEKDTGANLKATGEAVIHIPDVSLAEKMVASSAEVAADVDEFTLCELATVDSERIAPPRLHDARLAFETKVVSHQEVGLAPVDLFLLEIVLVHADDGILNERGRIDAEKLAACGRLGGISYTTTDAGNFKLARPK